MKVLSIYFEFQPYLSVIVAPLYMHMRWFFLITSVKVKAVAMFA